MTNLLPMQKIGRVMTHKWLVSLILSVAFFFGANSVLAQYSIVSTSKQTINFNSFTGSGFTVSPAAGQLDANDWAFTGMSDGDKPFDTEDLDGDYARGTTAGGVTTGGIYGFDLGGSDFGLGIQPGGSDFTPGTITLKVQNNTGLTILGFDLAYDIYSYNDSDRSNSLDFSYSSDDTSYTNIDELNYTTVEAAFTTNPSPADGLSAAPRSTEITSLSIADGDFFYLRWSSDDFSGAGSRDEIILDNIEITAIANVPATDYTLELLHIADQEAGARAVIDAPNLSAVMNALEAQDVGEDATLRLSSGDAIIPGLFFDASEAVYGSVGIADIQIQNELGLKAIALGNHEFDFGTSVLADLISGNATGNILGSDFAGANFPYLSTNLDFSTDANMASLAVAGAGAPQTNSITSSVVIDLEGEKIGVIGATTPTVDIISSPGDITITPADFDGTPSDAQITALATIIQTEVDALLAANTDVDKVILLAHMQRITIEQALAEKLQNVDVVVAGGSNTRLFDADDRARDGDSNQGTYPIMVDNAGGTKTAVVNTDGSYKYVGRLVIGFDAEGNIIPSTYDVAVSGAYATDAEGVNALAAASLIDPEIQAIADEIEAQIIATEGNVFGVSNVFLNGNRSGLATGTDPDGVRTQETNLGNITADANLAAAKEVEEDVLVSIKNGGGIRASIGQILVPAGETEAQRLPNPSVVDGDGIEVKPEGGISQNDIQTVLAFNNGLTLLTLTRTQLVEVLEHGVGALPSVAGRFPQVSGIKFSFDPASDPGSRIQNAAIVDEDGEIIDELVRNGSLIGDPIGKVRIVTLNFLAGGGDGYPYPQGPEANRLDLDNGNKDGLATFANTGSEQDALAEYLLENYSDEPIAFDEADLGPEFDERIQNLEFRNDDIFQNIEPSLDPALGVFANQFPISLMGSFKVPGNVFDESAAEIPAYDAARDQVFFTDANSGVVHVLDVTDASSPSLATTINLTGAPNSVAVYGDVVAVATEADPKQDPGKVEFFNAETFESLGTVTVGALPDMVTFNGDGTKVLTANEGEPNDDYSVDPEGSVSIITLPADLSTISDATVTVETADFTGVAIPDGVRIFGRSDKGAGDAADGNINADAAVDLEPEYITVMGDKAYVTLQENNALAIIDIPTAAVDAVLDLGVKDHSIPGNGLDASDKDDAITIAQWPVYGMYMPDAIASYQVNGKTYLVTANEGDAREYEYENGNGDDVLAFGEEERVKDLTLDPTAFPEAAGLQADEAIGRLTVTTINGDIDNDGDFDALWAYGTRSFTIWDGATGEVVWDSKNELEQLIAQRFPNDFNANNDENDSFESRSDNKGPEPEGVIIGEMDGKPYAFVGLERVGGIVIYDVSNPEAPEFAGYINNRDFSASNDDVEAGTGGGDLGPEGLAFISASDSDSGLPQLVVTNEVSGTVSIFEIGGAIPQIRITFVDNANELITLKNFGSEAAMISNYVLWTSEDTYDTLSSFTSIGSNFSLGVGEEVTVNLATGDGDLRDLNNIVGQVALFSSFASINSTSSLEFLDYVQYGGVLLNSSIAVQATAAGRWNSPEEFADQANPFSWTGNGTDLGSSFWQGSGLLTALEEDFAGSCPDSIPAGWALFETDANLAGCGGDDYIEFSGFAAGAGESYLLTPPMDLSGAKYALDFEFENDFSGPVSEVKVSTDYTDGDPTAATFETVWEIPFEGTVGTSGPINIPSGDAVTVAFVYSSNGTGGGNSSRLRIYEVNINETPIFFFEDFDASCETDDVPEGWVEFNESENDLINCATVDGNPFLDFNGFGVGAGVAWAITPTIDFTADNLLLSFEYLNQFGGPAPEVLYSTDYTGAGDPNAATWNNFTEASAAVSNGTGGAVVPVVVPASFINAEAYLAFKYTSEGSSGGQSLRYRINDVVVSKPIPVQPAGSLPIYAIQGNDVETLASPFEGQGVSTSGIVTAIFDGNEPFEGAGWNSSLGGFFIQDPVGDDDISTSDGIFVEAPGLVEDLEIEVGDIITLDALIEEAFGQTQLTEVENVVIQSKGNFLPVPIPFDLERALDAAVSIGAAAATEPIEGMYINFSGTEFTVTENRNLNNFGEIRVSAGGRLFQPTQLIDPNDADPEGTNFSGSINESAIINELERLDVRNFILDDGKNGRPDVAFPYIDPVSKSLPTGSTVNGLTGVITYGFGEYRIQPTQSPQFTYTERPATVPSVDGIDANGNPVEARLKVAAFNVLNYFNGNGDGTGFPTSRGADTFAEFEKQRDKIVEAIKVMNADVVGLMEIENDSGANNALEDLVTALNASIGSDMYAAVETGMMMPAEADPDEIRVAMIYKPAAVSLKGAFAVLTSAENPGYDDNRNRPALAQTFTEVETGEVFTVVVNHFKSKGSGCGDGDDNPFQGNCNGTRTEAAIAQAEWLATDPTGSGDTDFLIIGDINAYAQEDPMDAFRAAGYVNLEPDTEHSFIFDGQAGSLDHALAIFEMSAQVTGSATWHINADEPDYLAYDGDEDFFVADPFRSSDHDAIIVGLRLDFENTPPAPPIGQETVQIGISSSSDDAEQYLPGGSRPDNGMDIFSSDIELGQETGPGDPNFAETFQLSGLRFNNLPVPQNAVIVSASIQFTVDNTSKNTDVADLFILAEDNANPLTYADADGDITSRSYLSDSIDWNITGGWDVRGEAGPDQETPDLAYLVQQIVSKPDWAKGNSIAFVLGGSGVREAESFDNDEADPSLAAQLIINYIPTTSVQFPILSSTDDAEQYLPGGTRPDNGMDITSSDIELGQESDATSQLSGLRFDQVAIPQGALINQAYIQFTVDNFSKNTSETELYIVVEDSDNTATYQDVDGDITSRSYFSSDMYIDTVLWSIESGTWGEIGEAGLDQRSADISGLLEYIVGKDNWESGNAVSFVIGGTGIREACSFDNDPSSAAKLVVDFVPIVENTIQIAFSEDDAEEYLPGGSRPDNGMDITSSDIELGQESLAGEFGPATSQLSGLRFRNVDLPQGAIIESASIQFTVDNFSKNVDPTELYIVVEDAGDAMPYIDEDGNISTRNYYNDPASSVDTVEWNIAAGTWDDFGQAGEDQETPDIADLLQAVVNRADWLPGNAVAFVIGGSGIREAESFDGSPESAAVLKFSYAEGTPPPVVPEVIAEIEDIVTDVNASFSVDLNNFFEDADTKISYFATTALGRELPESISLDREEGVLRGFLANPGHIAIKIVAESFGDETSQIFTVSALPKPAGVLNQISTVTLGSFDEGAAEISAFDPESNTLFVTNAETDAIDILDYSDAANPTLTTSVDITTIDGINAGGVNSVAVGNGLLAAALENDNKQANGWVVVWDASDLTQLATYEVGALPDMVTFNEEGSVLVVANEGEPNDDYSIDPEGSVSVITLPSDFANAAQTDVATADFTAFNGQEDALRAEGVRIFGRASSGFGDAADGNTASASQDLEPEYITVSGDKAYVTLQENNALAIVDIPTATVDDILALGVKDHSMMGMGIDGTDRNDNINIATWPVYGMYMPDAITSIAMGEKTYLLTANEGDAREYEYEDGNGDDVLAFGEEERVKDLELDPTAFPDAEWLQSDEAIGRLTVTTVNGDIDGDGDYDALWAYGSRSFTIWDAATGEIVFDSGDDLEQITAAYFPEFFNASNDNSELKNRSDNKGPEPEAITVGQVGETTYAFIGLERVGGIMVYDITDPASPKFVEYINNRVFDFEDEDAAGTGDQGPEGIVFVSAEDSPSGIPLLIVSNEVSGSVTTYEVGDLPVVSETFTLELLHVTDQEAGAPAIQDAPRLSAVMNALEAEDLGADGVEDNTLRLSSGDSFIPGLFYDASGDAFGSRGVADIQIQNELSFSAISLGNHEFDFGTEVLAGLISGETAQPATFDLEGTELAGGVPFTGTDFPYLSSNLDFKFSEFLSGIEVAGGQAPQGGKVTSSTIVNVNGESIGVVGATTPTLASISSPDDVGISPVNFANNPSEEEIAALAEIIQEEVDVLLEQNPAMNKVILLAHMQRIDIEFALAEALENVDIIVAGGSNTRLTDSNDRLRDGDVSQGEYPAFFTNAGGTSTAVVNTDGSYKYVGRLVIDFDTDGNIITNSYDETVSGIYATDEQGVTDLEAGELIDPEIQAIASAIEDAIIAKESNVFGVASTYLNGNRSGDNSADNPDGVRTQETNLGNLTADANLIAARAVDSDVVVSIKNGGGIRASIGQILVPAGQTEPSRLPNEEVVDSDGNVVKPAGGISENDINTTLAFNNGLSLLTLTKTELKAVLEHGVAAYPSVAGQFIQVSGVNFSFDPELASGSRIKNAVFVDEAGETTATFISNGEIVGDATETVRIVTLNFLAGGGDNYPFPTGDAANRVNLYDLDGDGNDDGATGDATFANDGTEQDALAEYLLANFPSGTPFDAEDVGPVMDNRIQNLAFRADGLVNQAPEVIAEIADRSENEGFESVTIDLTTVFTDADGDELTYSVSASENAVVTIAIDNSNLVITELSGSYGLTTITVSANDGAVSTEDMFDFTVNNVAPVVSSQLPDVTENEGFGSVTIDLSEALTDVGTLTYSATSSDESVVTVSTVDAILTVTEVSRGTSIITVTASDVEGLTATDSFEFTVDFPSGLSLLNGLAVYPNPVSDILQVKHASMNITDIKVFSTSGHLVIESKESIVDVSSLDAGVYLIQIEDANAKESVITRFIKQ